MTDPLKREHPLIDMKFYYFEAFHMVVSRDTNNINFGVLGAQVLSIVGMFDLWKAEQ